MSKHLLNIISISIALVLFSCANQSMEKSDSMATESIPVEEKSVANDFVALEEQNTVLTSEQLKAFEERAIQKFEDFTDYLEIISNPKISDDMINQSLELVEELFINDSITMPNGAVFVSESLDSTPIFLMEYLKSIPVVSHTPKFHIKTKSIKFIKPLKKDSKNSYRGVLKVKLIINNKKWNKNVDIHLVQIQKDFGGTEELINEVRLGSIY